MEPDLRRIPPPPTPTSPLSIRAHNPFWRREKLSHVHDEAQYSLTRNRDEVLNGLGLVFHKRILDALASQSYSSISSSATTGVRPIPGA